MTTSGTISYGLTAQQLVDAALQKITVLGEGETASGDQYADAQRDLNVMLKSWQMTGPNLWTVAEQAVPLVSGIATYTLSPRPRRVHTVRWCNSVVTNRALYCRDWTNAAWTKSNMTTALTQTGIDNIASTATLLTASASNGTALQSVTRASDDWIFGLFMKRVTGTGAVYLTLDGSSTYTAVTDSINTDTWTQVGISQTSLTNPQFGVKIATSSDAVAVDYAMASLDGVSASAFEAIATTSANVSRYGEGRPMTEWGRNDYERSPIKAQKGDPVIYVLDRQIAKTDVTVWPIPNFTSGVQALRVGYERVWEDVTAPAQTLDVPQEWLETVIMNLAARRADDYRLTGEIPNRVREKAQELYMLMMYSDRQGDIRIRMGGSR